MEKYYIQRQSNFNEKRKVAIDSCVLIDLIDSPDFRSGNFQDIFKEMHIIFIHRISKEIEVPKILLEKSRFNRIEEANKEVNTFIDENNIHIIEDQNSSEELKNLKNSCQSKNIAYHFPDSKIIADFKKFGINTVYSTDYQFKKICKAIGFDVIDFPSFDRELNNQLKKLKFPFFRKKDRHKT